MKDMSIAVALVMGKFGARTVPAAPPTGMQCGYVMVSIARAFEP